MPPFLILAFQYLPLDLEKTPNNLNNNNHTNNNNNNNNNTTTDPRHRLLLAQPSVVTLVSSTSLLCGLTPYQAMQKPVGENFFGILKLTPSICYVSQLELTVSRPSTKSLECIAKMTFLRKLKLSAFGSLRTLEDADLKHLGNDNLQLLDELELTTGHRITDFGMRVFNDENDDDDDTHDKTEGKRNLSFNLQHSLRSLKFGMLLSVTVDGYRRLSHLRNLRVLHLENCFLSSKMGVSSSEAMDIFSAIFLNSNKNDGNDDAAVTFPLLEELFLINCTGLTRESLHGIPLLLPRLKSFSLADNAALTGRGISSLICFSTSVYSSSSQLYDLPEDTRPSHPADVESFFANKNYSSSPMTATTRQYSIREQAQASYHNRLRIASSITSLDISHTSAISRGGRQTELVFRDLCETFSDTFNQNFSSLSMRGFNLRGEHIRGRYGVNGRFLPEHVHTPLHILQYYRTFFSLPFDKISTRLLRLDLANSEIEDETILFICTSPSCVNLRELDISRCQRISIKSLHFLMNRQQTNFHENVALRRGVENVCEWKKLCKRRSEQQQKQQEGEEDETKHKTGSTTSLLAPTQQQFHDPFEKFLATDEAFYETMEKLCIRKRQSTESNPIYYTPLQVLKISGCPNFFSHGHQIAGSSDFHGAKLDGFSFELLLEGIHTLEMKELSSLQYPEEMLRDLIKVVKLSSVPGSGCVLKNLTIATEFPTEFLKELRILAKAGMLKLKVTSQK